MRRLALTLSLLLAACADRIVEPAAPGAMQRVSRVARITGDQYTVHFLPTLDAQAVSEVHDLDEHGHAVGMSGDRAVMWIDDEIREIITAGYGFAHANGINDRHEVVGFYADFDGRHAFLRRTTGEIIALPELPGITNHQAEKINAAGQIAGSGYSPETFSSVGVLWQPDGSGNYSVALLTPASGMRGAVAIDINTSGVIVGRMYDGISAEYHVGLWTAPGDAVDLGVGDVYGINAAGEYVAVVYLPGTGIKSFRATGMTRTYLDELNAYAFAINDDGLVAGFVLYTEPYHERSAIWAGSAASLIPTDQYGSGRPYAMNNGGVLGGNIGAKAVLWLPPQPVVDLDADDDGFANAEDNCPAVFNSQSDFDGDGVGDACDPDAEGDGVDDLADNCRYLANADQSDVDRDGVGDACDTDNDNDGVANEADNCPTAANADQRDQDQDGIGDECDPTPLPYLDADSDGVPDADDNCPTLYNPSQRDSDHDGIGNPCDPTPLPPPPPDTDGDGVLNGSDNCPAVSNADQADLDDDGAGDACDVMAAADVLGALSARTAALGAKLAPPLLSKLDAADGSIARGQSKAAAGQINAFINQLTAMVKRGDLTAAGAEPLFARARAMLARL